MPTENRSSNVDMVSVPREPTEEMIVAFAEAWYSKRQTIDDPDMLDAYKAMLAVAPAEQHQGEPVAYQRRCKTVHEGSQWRHWIDCTEEDYRKTIDNPGPTSRGVIREARKLYTRADVGEVERLRAECRDLRLQLRGAAHVADRLRRSCLGLRRQALAELLGYLSGYSASTEPGALVERDELPPFALKVLKKLRRTQECFEDSQGTDIGRDWLDVLVRLGLMNRVQRSPALWEISDAGDALLEARAALERKPA
ncbi:hypothetical protein [Pseudomonas sp. zfem002]|uniref:hypothetical protein n=1 Tax=Pseudomonas sp. zfem002 TaxID=3078197 RepID=UPI002928DCAE|nr:hypothetical protein [Pseudomonas sp. zfem002]MDU9391883.1 hypothetical protein [Pseudomonas sp. zfem002]